VKVTVMSFFKGRKGRALVVPLMMVALAGSGHPSLASAGDVKTLAPVEVIDTSESLEGSADSSTEGTVTQKQLEDRPLLRTGELLEAVPGLWISQHSGEGKANQYYLRGINLDHGTDLETSVAGMPVNMPTHAHGQGYTDLNFIIPELVSGVQYRKGPYYAEEGDFSAAGAVHMDYQNALKHNIGVITGGTDGYYRGLAAASGHLAGGDLLFALEYFHNDGPWVNPDDYRKLNGVVRFSKSVGHNDFSLTAMGYHGKWNSTDQVPQRALDAGLISRFGAIDPTDGGTSYRYSLSGDWQHTGEDSVSKATVYLIGYGMYLYSDFTYFLNDPVHGDQFLQKDRRVITGVNASQTWMTRVAGRDMDNTVGLQIRNDNIAPVGLYATEARQIIHPGSPLDSQDHVVQTSYGLYLQDSFKWAEKFRSVAGVRGDYFTWHVVSNRPENSGDAEAFIASPKLSLIFGPWAKTELFLNGGYGFHSNDGRGTTITVDPKTGPTMVPDSAPVSKVTPLVRAKGAEVGTRSTVIPHLQSELTLWLLDFDSELLFTGDAGTTEPSRPSRRYGVEFANTYTPTTWLTCDANLAFSHARFTDSEPLIGDHIPGAPVGVASAGVSVDDLAGFLGSIRMQWFGPRPLIEDNSVRSDATTIFNARVGYKFKAKPVENWRLMVDVFNVFDTKVSDIDYYYTSRLPGEPAAGVSDIHTHPHEPREARVTLSMKF